jgi:small conductance mechanosensitive channel
VDNLANYLASLPLLLRLAAFVGLAIITHLIVAVIRHVATSALTSQHTSQYQKLRSIATLTTSAVVFVLYFLAIGLVLRELGVSLTADLASASIVGLAIGFGSQGIVQDVVTGLTLIFSDLVDVGDLVKISDQTGIVRAITMRFVQLENAMGATVFLPNRTISSIVSFPKGYLRCLVDITLRGDETNKRAIEAAAIMLMDSVNEQFGGILIRPPSSEGRITLNGGKEFLRIKFRIWPDRGQAIETTYLQELLAEIRRIDADYQPWMIAISYEAEKKLARPKPGWPWRSTPIKG